MAETQKIKETETKIFTIDETIQEQCHQQISMYSLLSTKRKLPKKYKEFIKNFQGIEEKKYYLINTHWVKKNRLTKMEKLLSKKKMAKVAAVDFQIGKDEQTVNGLMKSWEAKFNEFVGKL